MNRLIIVLDSLRFYKLKNENTARILFLIIYAIFLGFYIFPLGEPIDSDAITKILQGSTAFNISLISPANIIYYSSQFGIYLITSFIGLLYAASHVMEAEGFPNRKAIIAAFRGLPKLIGFLLLMIIPLALSSLLAFLPFIFLFYALFFTPLLIIEGKNGIIKAVAESFRSTKGIRFSIFITQMIIYFLMSIPISLFSSAFIYVGYDATLAEFLILSFLRAAYVLMGGRLAGNFYLLAVKNEEKLRKIKLGFLNIGNENISEIDRENINNDANGSDDDSSDDDSSGDDSGSDGSDNENKDDGDEDDKDDRGRDKNK